MTIKIAYLAPEIPALSATFVYQEIVQLETLGIDIIPVSIHRPLDKEYSEDLVELEKKTLYLYEQSNKDIAYNNIKYLINHPLRYISTFLMAVSDAFNMGVFSHIGKGIVYRFFIAVSLMQQLKNSRICHIHANFAHIPTDIAMYASKLAQLNYSFTSHANDLFERGWLLEKKINRSKFGVTISNYNKTFLVKNGGDKDKINVIHCGVNTSDFIARDRQPDNAIPVLGALGRMVEKKGFDVLIAAISLLKKENYICKLQIVGSGPLLEAHKKQVIDNGLLGQVEFTGAISHDAVPIWMKSLDMFILPSKKDINGDMDGIPVVLMEAMLTGVPVISTNISGIPELIEDKLTGLLCNENDPHCIAEKIKEILLNKENSDYMCENAIQHVQKKYELSSNTKKLAEFIFNACSVV